VESGVRWEGPFCLPEGPHRPQAPHRFAGTLRATHRPRRSAPCGPTARSPVTDRSPATLPRARVTPAGLTRTWSSSIRRRGDRARPALARIRQPRPL